MTAGVARRARRPGDSRKVRRGNWLKAVAKITEHVNVLLAFYDYPAEHWIHLRTTNPIESTFATVRLRQRITKGPGSRAAGIAMAYKLIEAAQSRWRTVNAPHLVALVRAGRHPPIIEPLAFDQPALGCGRHTLKQGVPRPGPNGPAQVIELVSRAAKGAGHRHTRLPAQRIGNTGLGGRGNVDVPPPIRLLGQQRPDKVLLVPWVLLCCLACRSYRLETKHPGPAAGTIQASDRSRSESPIS